MSTSNITSACPFSKNTCGVLENTEPVIAKAGFSASKPIKDNIKFGMDRNPSQGCCITRFVGGESGCCPQIKQGKEFEAEYIQAVERVIKETGEMPKLDARVEIKLKEMKELERLEAMAKGATPGKTLSKPDEPLIKRILLAPFRWLKWLFKGLWKDLKIIFTGKREEPKQG